MLNAKRSIMKKNKRLISHLVSRKSTLILTQLSHSAMLKNISLVSPSAVPSLPDMLKSSTLGYFAFWFGVFVTFFLSLQNDLAFSVEKCFFMACNNARPDYVTVYV